jgi:hypothetical protein
LPEKKVSPKLLPKKVQPKKSNSKKQAPKSWQLIAAVVAGVLLVGSGIGVGAYQIYTQTQLTAALQAESAIDLGEKRIREVTQQLSELELAVQNAMEVEVGSQGRTLDEKDREALTKEIEKAKQTWVEQKTKLLYLESAVDALKKLRGPDDTFTANVEPLVAEITKATEDNWQLIVTQVSTLGKLMGNVQTAQASWQQEQDRIAAEKAAIEAAEAAERLARAKRISSVSTLSDDGGRTAPSTPAPPAADEVVATVDIAVGSAEKTFIESYVLALAPNSFIRWVPNMCDGYYACGLAWVGGYFDTPVRIELDSELEAIYVNEIGITVLVHEAAHARQWFKYGGDIITAMEALTASVPASRRWPNGVSGTNSVEYMADCMTIQKLGKSTGAYTSTCTPEQLSAAATIW